MNEVTLFGDINIDVLMSIPAYPPAGGDAMANHVVLRPGGSVANTAIVLAKLGVKTRLIGRTGADIWAELATQPLRELSIDLTAVHVDQDKATGLIFIPVNRDGERTMFSYRGANTHTSTEQVEFQTIANSSILHISAYNFLEEPQRTATWKAVDFAKRAGVPLSMDVGVEPSRRAAGDILKILPDLTYLVLGIDEARELVPVLPPEEMIRVFLQKGVKIIGLKLGREGCFIGFRANIHRLPAFQVDTLDSTGAGDAFCAGALFGFLRGMSLPATGLLANLLGALATTVWGGGPALPGREDAVVLLKEQGGSLLEARDSLQYKMTGTGEMATWTTEVLHHLQAL